MPYNLRQPCHGCPFRRDSAPGWLGDYTAEQIVDIVRNDGTFLCHNLVDYEDPDWRNQEHEECAGAMIFARKLCKLSRDPEKAAAQLQIDKSQDILFPDIDFISHHNY